MVSSYSRHGSNIASHVNDEEIADILGDEQLQGATREAARRIEKQQIIA